MTSEKEKIANLAKVQELIIHLDQKLLDSFFEEVAAFQTDRNSDVRKFVVGFIEEACKKDVAMLPRLVPNIQILLADSAIAVVKRVIQAAAQLHRATLAWLSSARTTTPEMEQVWHIITLIKNSIISMIDHDNDGVRTQAIKFLESLVLLQTYKEADSVTREGEFNLDLVPLTLKAARPRKLEEEARMVLNKLISFQGSLHISSVNLMTCMSSLTIIARARPQFLAKIINALEILHANLPPTLTKSQVNSVRKHLKIQMLNLLKHPASYDHHENITTVLNDLGVTAAEVNKSMPSKDQIRKRVRRDKSTDEGGEPTSKKSRIDKDEKKESKEVTEKQSAIDITQRWLVDELTTETVASLVMVNMLNLPEEMPPLFSAAYTPITAAGSHSQIQHMARLLASQLTAAGLGPGAEQVKEDEVETGHDSDEEGNIRRLVSGYTDEAHVQPAGPVLTPAGVIGRPMRQKVRTMKLAEVTKPLPSPANNKMQLVLLRRLLRCDKMLLQGSTPKVRMRIVSVLSGCLSPQECEELEDFILDDMANHVELMLSWLYAEYSVSHEFSKVHSILHSHSKPGTKKEKSYTQIFTSIISKAIAKRVNKETEEFFLRLFLESPVVPEESVTSLIALGRCAGDTILTNDLYGPTVRILKDIILWRPPISKPAIRALCLLASHDQEQVREQVIPVILELCKDDESIQEAVAQVATNYLKYLLLESPPEVLCLHELGRPNKEVEWAETSVKACLFLYLALLPMNQELIYELAQVYVKTVNEAKRAILRMLEGPIQHMGMNSPHLLKLVETCPKGGETLITRIIHILTEKAPPSEALVCRVRELYNRRVSDVRFLIPVLTGLSKKEVIAVLPKLIKLNPHVVKEVFNRLWGVTLDTGTSPLTPVDLLVALHLIDNEKCDVKTVIKATGLCFAERNIYTAEVLAFVLQQLMEQPNLPTLFMRTVIQTLTHYPKLLGFIMNILQRLIAKQVWKQKKVWEGFIKCCQRATPQSYTVLLQLPAEQLSDVFSSAPELRTQLGQHLSTLTDNQRAHIPVSLLDVIEENSNGASEMTSEPPPPGIKD